MIIFLTAVSSLDDEDINIFEAAVTSFNEEVIRFFDFHLMSD